MTEALVPLASSLVLGVAAVLITAMVCAAALKAWRLWLDLKRLELACASAEPEAEKPAALIELASVRERLRRLEAIANGVEL